MKFALMLGGAAVLLAAGTTGWFSYRVSRMPESRYSAIHSIADIRQIETTFTPDFIRSDLTFEQMTEAMDHYAHDRQILLVQPTDDVCMSHGQLIQKVQVKQVYEGDQALSGTELPISYYFFHIQTYAEMEMARSHGKTCDSPNVYHPSFMNYMDPASECLVFVNRYQFLDHTVYTAPHPNVPWNFSLTDTREPAIVPTDAVCSYSQVSDGEIFVEDQAGAENWKKLKQQILAQYCI
ncbi:MAG: hypothetical protein VZR73_05175 [Acutalibacteraceae bacterium]|nr:hypothetical protein [Acutalibacteraceae bacterium]